MLSMNVEVKPPAAAYKLLIEKDVDVPMRDGARLKADVFRPDDGGKFPAILNLGPYQKDKLWVPPPQLEEKATPHMNWETVTPEWWVPKGYAAVRVDGRGSGKSPGQCEPWSLAEAVDFYDAIEWAAAQPWCNGKVGLSGISYFAINQWFVANLQPPSLKAIIPWEGFADIYRDALFHGGLLSVFMTNWVTAHMMHHVMGRAAQLNPDGWQTNTLWHWLHHNLDSGVLRGSQAQWDRITVPMLTVGNWTGFALHLRGNTEAYMRAASKHKKLRIHNGSHVHPFYTEEGKRDQLRFLDHWLKGIDNGVMDEPPVKLAIRKGRDEIEWRHENEWPLARTQWTKFYFDVSPPPLPSPASGGGKGGGEEPRVGSLVREKPAKASSCTYPAFNLGTMGSTSAASSQVMGGGIKPGMGIALSTPPMTEDTEITGPLAATFFVSSESEDMDLFLTLRHFGTDNAEIMETGQQGTPVPVAKGWLRVSHRELDPELSLPFRPYHKHTRRLFLKPGEIVKVDVEIWPTSMTFKKGHRIQLDVQPRDGVGSQSYLHYHADYNTGTNTIYAGGEYESYLLLPVIPKAGA
jgi:putative CocE/NonD family hydrolase